MQFRTVSQFEASSSFELLFHVVSRTNAPLSRTLSSLIEFGQPRTVLKPVRRKSCTQKVLFQTDRYELFFSSAHLHSQLAACIIIEQCSIAAFLAPKSTDLPCSIGCNRKRTRRILRSISRDSNSQLKTFVYRSNREQFLNSSNTQYIRPFRFANYWLLPLEAALEFTKSIETHTHTHADVNSDFECSCPFQNSSNFTR